MADGRRSDSASVTHLRGTRFWLWALGVASGTVGIALEVAGAHLAGAAFGAVGAVLLVTAGLLVMGKR